MNRAKAYSWRCGRRLPKAVPKRRGVSADNVRALVESAQVG